MSVTWRKNLIDFHVYGSCQSQESQLLTQRRAGFLVFALAVLSLGCALTQEVTKTPRNATEQLLLSQALERAIEHITLPFPEGEAIRVEVTGLQTDRVQLRMDEQDAHSGVIDGPSWDLGFVRDVVAGRLGALGYRVQKSEEESRYLIRIVVSAYDRFRIRHHGA